MVTRARAKKTQEVVASVPQSNGRNVDAAQRANEGVDALHADVHSGGQGATPKQAWYANAAKTATPESGRRQGQQPTGSLPSHSSLRATRRRSGRTNSKADYDLVVSSMSVARATLTPKATVLRKSACLLLHLLSRMNFEPLRQAVVAIGSSGILTKIALNLFQ